MITMLLNSVNVSPKGHDVISHWHTPLKVKGKALPVDPRKAYLTGGRTPLNLGARWR
jgi:hypothetical protein